VSTTKEAFFIQYCAYICCTATICHILRLLMMFVACDTPFLTFILTFILLHRGQPQASFTLSQFSVPASLPKKKPGLTGLLYNAGLFRGITVALSAFMHRISIVHVRPPGETRLPAWQRCVTEESRSSPDSCRSNYGLAR